LQYTILGEDLASTGYVAAAIDAPYSARVVAFSDGRVITRSPKGSASTSGPRSNFDYLAAVWAADSSFVVSKLATVNREAHSPFQGQLDATRVGALGYSFGGAASARIPRAGSPLQGCRRPRRVVV
jgi:predicted dienelactone hydrolase